MRTIAELLHYGRKALTPVSQSPVLDAELLLAHVLERSRSHLHAWPEKTVAPPQQALFQSLLERRRHGEPVAYLLGRREFWSLEFQVNPRVLIPRPDTELLVERALALIPENANWQVADLGTGSGAIAVTLGRERPTIRITATDVSMTALATAYTNACHLGTTNVTFICSDWLAPFATASLDMIVSNPPYIAADDPYLAGEIRFEPLTALVAGEDGLDAFRRLIPQAHTALKAGGWLLLEHGHDQARPVSTLLEQAGFRNITCHRDLQGHPRITQAQRSS